MQNRRKIRELAMQILFAWDAHGRNDEGMARQVTHDASDDPVLRQMAVNMATGTWDQRELIDTRVERLAPQWPPRRQPAVDRNLLRMAVWELTNTQTPPKVVIDEAIELAKEFSTEQSAGFVNGVLDSVLKEHQALQGGGTVAATPVESGAPPVAPSDADFSSLRPITPPPPGDQPPE
jgi:N utilization substance protein B